MADIKALGDQLVNLTVKEVNELATYLKDEYKIEPAAAAVAVAAPAGGGGGAAAAEEKTSFDVILKNGGANKLAVVPWLRSSKPPSNPHLGGAGRPARPYPATP